MNMRSDAVSFVRGAYAFSTAVAAVLAGGVAHAQQAQDGAELDEIIVTAQKREQSIQDVALSISALTGTDLQSKGAEGFRDWANYVPNVTMYQGLNANRRAGPTAVVRGVSQTGAGQLQEVSTQATTSYMLGQVPVMSGDPGLFDINRIEVLRGPQGTLFGIASMGGTIRFIPNEAQTDALAAEVGLGVGSITDGGLTSDFDFVANVPLIEDKLAVRFAATHRESDGYIDLYVLPLDANEPSQIFVDGGMFDPRSPDGDGVIQDVNSTATTGGRLSLKYMPNDRFRVTAFTMSQKSDQRMKQAIDYNDRSGGWAVSRFTFEPQQDEFSITSLEASYDLGFGSLEYIGGYFDNKLTEVLDATPLAATFLNGTGANAGIHVLDMDGPAGLPRDPWPSPSVFPFSTETRIVTNELRLQDQDKSLGSLTFDYVVGAFHMSEKRHGLFSSVNPTWNANRGANTFPILTDGGLMLGDQGGGQYDGTAAFADFTLHLTQKLAVGAGVRYSESERESGTERWGDASSGRAANGATEGDDLNEPGVVGNVGNVEEDNVTPRATVTYSLDGQKMLFFTVAKGQRSPTSFPDPGFFSRPGPASNPACIALAQSLGVNDDAVNGTTSDTVWSYDLGIKSRWLDRRLLLNTSLYYLEWADLQRNFQLFQFNPQCTVQIPANVGGVDIRGAELEIVYIPIDSLKINVALGYTDAQIAETVLGVNDSLGQPLEKGDGIENVAPWTAAVGLEYRFAMPFLENPGSDLKGFVRADWRFTDERMGPNLGDEASLKADPIRSQFIADAYALTDLRFGVISDTWSASLYAANVANERAIFESFRSPSLPNQRTTAISRPRTIGFTIRKHFY